MRFLRNIFMFVAAITAATGILRISYSYFVSEELAMSEGRLSLYQSTVNAEFDRFSHLTYVLSRDTFVMQTAQGGETNALNQRLAEFTQQAGLDAIYLMDTTGRTIAASNYGDASSFIDQNYSFRPYFQQALLGGQGRFYAIGTTTGLPGYFIADAVRDAGGVIRGVIAIKIGFSQLEESWRRSGEQVLLTNEDGVVLLSSDPAWRYQVLEALSETQRAHIENSRQFSGQALAPLDWVSLPDHRAEIAGTDRLHLMAETSPHGWELHYFASDDRAVARSWLVIIFVVLLAGIALILLQRQRARRVAAALRSSEQEEAKLRRANDRLAVEISERNTAERRLKRTEQELERASRLAALGQLSASVTHELGQPIAAMRNHLTAAEMNPKKATGLTSKIGSLVDRMEGITRELKFFARSENIEFKDVDLSEALQVALGLVAPNIDAYGVEIQTFLPEEAVLIRGNKLRIEQVMTNLLRNAIDATEDSDRPIVQITLETVASESRLTISDNGHGLGKSTLSELQEPFVTTRESGRGMGLGLAISTSIIHDHGGAVTAKNNDAGGAVFVVSFPMPDAEVE